MNREQAQENVDVEVSEWESATIRSSLRITNHTLQLLIGSAFQRKLKKRSATDVSTQTILIPRGWRAFETSEHGKTMHFGTANISRHPTRERSLAELLPSKTSLLKEAAP